MHHDTHFAWTCEVNEWWQWCIKQGRSRHDRSLIKKDETERSVPAQHKQHNEKHITYIDGQTDDRQATLRTAHRDSFGLTKHKHFVRNTLAQISFHFVHFNVQIHQLLLLPIPIPHIHLLLLPRIRCHSIQLQRRHMQNPLLFVSVFLLPIQHLFIARTIIVIHQSQRWQSLGQSERREIGAHKAICALWHKPRRFGIL